MSLLTNILDQLGPWELRAFLQRGGTLPHSCRHRHQRIQEAMELVDPPAPLADDVAHEWAVPVQYVPTELEMFAGVVGVEFVESCAEMAQAAKRKGCAA